MNPARMAILKKIIIEYCKNNTFLHTSSIAHLTRTFNLIFVRFAHQIVNLTNILVKKKIDVNPQFKVCIIHKKSNREGAAWYGGLHHCLPLRRSAGLKSGQPQNFIKKIFQSALTRLVIYTYIPGSSSVQKIRNIGDALFCTEI